MQNQIQISIPEKLENLQLPSPELITFYKNLDDRVLWLDTDVDDCYLEYSRNILQWNKEDINIPTSERKPIRLMIYSYGGDLDVNNSFVDIITLSKTPVYGYNMGVAASAGCFIFLACHKRFAMPNSYFLIHKGSTENISGSFDQVLSYIQEYQRKIDELAEYILQHTNIDEDILTQNLGTEWYISAKDAISFGVCDTIISDINQIFV